jgi:hypothetical protein
MTALPILILIFVGNALLFLMWSRVFIRKLNGECPLCGSKEQ